MLRAKSTFVLFQYEYKGKCILYTIQNGFIQIGHKSIQMSFFNKIIRMDLSFSQYVGYDTNAFLHFLFVHFSETNAHAGFLFVLI